MKRSFNISNFISSHSKVFGHLGVLKILRKKHMCWSIFLVNFQAFNLQSAILTNKEHLAHTFSSEFCKNFENTILIENLRLTPSVTLTIDRLGWGSKNVYSSEKVRRICKFSLSILSILIEFLDFLIFSC